MPLTDNPQLSQRINHAMEDLLRAVLEARGIPRDGREYEIDLSVAIHAKKNRAGPTTQHLKETLVMTVTAREKDG